MGGGVGGSVLVTVAAHAAGYKQKGSGCTMRGIEREETVSMPCLQPKWAGEQESAPCSASITEVASCYQRLAEAIHIMEINVR